MKTYCLKRIEALAQFTNLKFMEFCHLFGCVYGEVRQDRSHAGCKEVAKHIVPSYPLNPEKSTHYEIYHLLGD